MEFKTLKLQNITKRYGKLVANDSINIEIKKGEVIGIVGPNGSGKTTMMKIISGLIKNYEGDYFIDNLNSREFVNKNFVKYFGIYIEKPNLLERYTGYENLKFFRNYFYGSKSKINRKDDFEEVIDKLDLSTFIYKKVKNYSLGMKQRLAIAVALLSRPDFCILDEPTNGMDIESSNQVLEYLKSRKMDTGFLVSSHILDTIEAICDKIYVLKKGKIVSEFNLKEFKEKYNNMFIVNFKREEDILGINSDIIKHRLSDNIVVVPNDSSSYDLFKELKLNNIEFDIEDRSVTKIFYDISMKG